MIKIYVRVSQLINFIDRKEPVELYVEPPLQGDFAEIYVNTKDIIIKSYASHSTIEYKTFRKLIKGGLKRGRK